MRHFLSFQQTNQEGTFWIDEVEEMLEEYSQFSNISTSRTSLHLEHLYISNISKISNISNIKTIDDQQYNKDQSMANIKYFSFAKSSASVPIYSYCQDKPNEDQLKLESTKVLRQLNNLNLRPEERQKINTGNGCWYCKKDSKGIIYFILCSTNYPERHIMAAINSLRDHLAKLGEYESEPDASLKMHSKDVVKEICVKYENLKGVDKISEINDNLSEIRSSVSEGTRKMLTNQVQLDLLEKKSETLKQHAHQFSESATELERLMYWRNCKLKIIIGLVIICLLVLIIVPIVTKNTK